MIEFLYHYKVDSDIMRRGISVIRTKIDERLGIAFLITHYFEGDAFIRIYKYKAYDRYRDFNDVPNWDYVGHTYLSKEEVDILTNSKE